ncbi:MAG: sensor histidine kinase [Victivallales bacterium]|nr:sensor histidine kinase [Victivallales bacterium]
MNRPIAKTGLRNADLTSVKERLRKETVRRKAAEESLKQNKKRYSQLLANSHRMQKQMQYLSHQVLLAQEEERRNISRELHDDISQILTGINVRLAALKIEVTTNTGNIRRKIATTQRLVEKSVAAVHRFARELRPAMLDDLGLIPALHSFMKEFGKRTGLQLHFTARAAGKIEQLSNIKRTVLYRVAQEALTNVTKHAKASQAKVSIGMQSDAISMTVADNGKSFDIDYALKSTRAKRLGILGMRERVEMVGGAFAITSALGKGTTVSVQIPINGARKKISAAA